MGQTAGKPKNWRQLCTPRVGWKLLLEGISAGQRALHKRSALTQNAHRCEDIRTGQITVTASELAASHCRGLSSTPATAPENNSFCGNWFSKRRLARETEERDATLHARSLLEPTSRRYRC